MKTVIYPLFAASLVVSTPVAAQDSAVGKRVERLEKEMRAVQRKVFPGGSGQFFEPDIKPDANKPASASTTTSAVTDLIARVDALERSMANLTGQVEQNGFRLKKLEDMMASSGSTEPAATSAGTTTTQTPATTSAKKPASSAPAPDPDRVRGVASIIMPDTGDAGEDSYIYGYRLWDAKYYPEARTQLKKTLDKYPSHRRASFAHNLMGRAFLDDGKPANAAVVFHENYQKRPRGERAPDSLYFLSVALNKRGQKDEACRALAELQDAYPTVTNGRLSGRVTRGKAASNCR